MKIGVLKAFGEDRYKFCVKACEELNVDYQIIDLDSSNWISLVKESKCDGFVHMPSCSKQVYKTMYDERLYFINKILGYPIYPNYSETFIYENKKNMAYWLEANNFPHAKTFIFYNKSDALKFAKNYNKYPLYFKTSIGSAALGVKKIKSKRKAIALIQKTFSKLYFFGHGFTKWIKSKKYKISFPFTSDRQIDFIIFQEAIDAVVEWRIIKIGNSYFGHQKLNKNGSFSGSGLVGWADPPKKLFELTKEVCDKGHFDSMDLDIFEDKNGNYYINEMQTIFGSYNESQMYINNVPGRYQFIDGNWVFEEGKFNRNYSFNLRIESFIEMLKNEKI